MKWRWLLVAAVASPVVVVLVVVGNRFLPGAEAPPGFPPGIARAATQACTPLGRVDALRPDGGFRCTWSPLGWPSFESSMSCADGEWNGPQGWNEWGAYGVPCQGRAGLPPTTSPPEDGISGFALAGIVAGTAAVLTATAAWERRRGMRPA